MDERIIYNVRGVAHSDKPIENYLQILQFTSGLPQRFNVF